jgi:hypothetical protein
MSIIYLVSGGGRDSLNSRVETTERLTRRTGKGQDMKHAIIICSLEISLRSLRWFIVGITGTQFTGSRHPNILKIDTAIADIIDGRWNHCGKHFSSENLIHAIHFNNAYAFRVGQDSYFASGTWSWDAFLVDICCVLSRDLMWAGIVCPWPKNVLHEVDLSFRSSSGQSQLQR